MNMRKKIKAKDLKIGMYAELPVSWLNHPFLKNRFTIESREQINKIIGSGFDEIFIDTSKGLPVTETESISHGDEVRGPPQQWDPEELVPADLKEAIHSKTLSSEEKSKIVYTASLKIMERLFEDPKAEKIQEAKKGIADIVDFIISEDATSRHLLKITSYDYYTYTHSVNVGVFSVVLSKELFRGSYAHDMHELGAGFFLHDIGKVRVDQEIINKPGKLTDNEMMEMRMHPDYGYAILSETNQLTEECKIIVMQHHERADGTGYPHKLKGDAIHMYGRICSIADVFDALTAERSYKRKLTTFKALKLMKEEMIDHFHKEVFEQFVLLFT
jgi:HD-GYP domain-containing protein (c-di-GMP phosphodiesterase class II)